MISKSPAKNHFLKILFSILFFCLLTVSLVGCGGGGGGGGGGSSPTPSITTWAKTFGGVNEDVAHSVQQTTDGGYIVAGGTSSSGAGFADFWIIKLNPNGEIDWQKTFYESNDDVAKSIQQTSDGGYIVAGQSSSLGNPLGDIWILKLNSNGDIDWQYFFGESGSSIANDICEIQGGGFIVAGNTNRLGLGAGRADVWILKLDASGNPLPWWPKMYGGTNDDTAYSIQQTSDGGFIVAGETYSYGDGYADVWILKLDVNGTVLWQNTFGGTNYDRAYSIEQTTDGYIVAGETSSSGAGSADVWVLKLDVNGAPQTGWPKTYGGVYRDAAYSIRQTSDGGFIIAGETSSSGAGNADFWILKLNASGDIVWQKTYGGSGDDIARSIQQTSDGGFIVAGETYSSGAGSSDFWVLKIDGNGNVN
ncbi:MAG: hypothetical protein QME78_13085 [Thermodesulfobacteriota bacterium]|nr:hypothetical protein [Thermodesulfobacteriota bacterium]